MAFLMAVCLFLLGLSGVSPTQDCSPAFVEEFRGSDGEYLRCLIGLLAPAYNAGDTSLVHVLATRIANVTGSARPASAYVRVGGVTVAAGVTNNLGGQHEASVAFSTRIPFTKAAQLEEIAHFPGATFWSGYQSDTWFLKTHDAIGKLFDSRPMVNHSLVTRYEAPASPVCAEQGPYRSTMWTLAATLGNMTIVVPESGMCEEMTSFGPVRLIYARRTVSMLESGESPILQAVYEKRIYPNGKTTETTRPFTYLTRQEMKKLEAAKKAFNAAYPPRATRTAEDEIVASHVDEGQDF